MRSRFWSKANFVLSNVTIQNVEKKKKQRNSANYCPFMQMSLITIYLSQWVMICSANYLRDLLKSFKRCMILELTFRHRPPPGKFKEGTSTPVFLHNGIDIILYFIDFLLSCTFFLHSPPSLFPPFQPYFILFPCF